MTVVDWANIMFVVTNLIYFIGFLWSRRRADRAEEKVAALQWWKDAYGSTCDYLGVYPGNDGGEKERLRWLRDQHMDGSKFIDPAMEAAFKASFKAKFDAVFRKAADYTTVEVAP